MTSKPKIPTNSYLDQPPLNILCIREEQSAALDEGQNISSVWNQYKSTIRFYFRVFKQKMTKSKKSYFQIFFVSCGCSIFLHSSSLVSFNRFLRSIKFKLRLQNPENNRKENVLKLKYKNRNHLASMKSANLNMSMQYVRQLSISQI